jgi:protein phosphatase
MDLTQALEIASCTDPGMVRSHNEDSIASDAASGLVVLADGMGGYNAGEVASGIATTVITTELKNLFGKIRPFEVDPQTNAPVAARMVREQVKKANTSIFQAAQSQPQYAGMGTTLVVALFYDNKILVAHLGDSRLSRLRGADFRQITRDHSLLQEQIDAGLITPEQAAFSANKNLVTRAVGVEDTVLLETHLHDVQPGDLYLMCSDGLSDMLDNATLAQLLQTHDELPRAGRALIDAANEAGGKDNIALVLVRVAGNPASNAKPWWRFGR